MIKFVHCSDIHLGANPYSVEEKMDDMKVAFCEAVNFAVSNRVDFFIIAGDLFDKKVLNAKTLEQAMEAIKPLNDAKIPVYVIEGNHDSSTILHKYSWLEFLSQRGSIILLKPDGTSLNRWDELTKTGCIYETDQYVLYGLGYPGVTSKSYINQVTSSMKKTDKILITILHTGIDRFVTEGMAGLREEDAKELFDMSDYIALGHIHNRYQSEENKYYNPGSLENVRIPQKEEEKGFYFVTIDEKTKKVRAEHKATLKRPTYNLTIDLSVVNNLDGATEYIVEAVKKNVKENEKEMVLQLKLRGELKEGGTQIHIGELKERLQKEFSILYIEILNLMSNKKRGTNDQESYTREEIEERVMKDLILEEGFQDKDIDALYDVVKMMKQTGMNEEVLLSSKEGEELVDKITKIIV